MVIDMETAFLAHRMKEYHGVEFKSKSINSKKNKDSLILSKDPRNHSQKIVCYLSKQTFF